MGGVLISVLSVVMIATGVQIRRARWWRLALNIAAIALFLELTLLPDAFATLFALMDAIVLFALIRHRGWFLWNPEDARAAQAEAAGRRDGAQDGGLDDAGGPDDPG